VLASLIQARHWSLQPTPAGQGPTFRYVGKLATVTDAARSIPKKIARRFTAACAVAVLASALINPLRAQQAASATSYGGPLLDRSTLSGDWGGAARDDLAARGITITPSLTQFYQGPTAGNTSHIFDYGGKAETFLNIDAAKLGLWDGFGIQVHGEYNFGKTPGEVGGTTLINNTAMTFPFQNKPGGDLTSVFFSQRFGSNFTLLAGKMNMFDFYAAGHKFSGGRGIEGFWNVAFVGPPSGFVPIGLFGAIGTYKIDPLSFTTMVYDPRDALNRTGFEHLFGEGVTVRNSVDLSSEPFGLPRTDSLTSAITSQEDTDFSTLPDLSQFTTPTLRRAIVQSFTTGSFFDQRSEIKLAPDNKDGRYWFGYSFEQTLWESPADRTKSWGLFGQAAVSDGNPSSIRWSAIGGVGGTSPLPGRLNDKFGVGILCYGYSNELKKQLTPLVKLGNEYGAELFYNFALTKWFRVTADVQVIAPAINAQVNSASPGNPTVVNNSTVVLLGMRAQVSF
jgi:porin